VLLGGNHRFDWVSTFGFREVYNLPGAYRSGIPWSPGDVRIDTSAYLGRGVRVLPGVRIGTDAVIDPYSVITRDVSDGQHARGHPARPAVPATRLFDSPSPDRPGPLATSVARSLRRAADLLWPPAISFPSLREPAVEPQPIEMGTGSYFVPVVRNDHGGGGRVVVGPYASVSFDTEFVFGAVSDGRRIAQAYEPNSGVAGRETDGRPGGAAGDPPGKAAGGRPEGPVEAEPGPVAVVGSDTWVARGTRIVGAVTIGHGAVVAAHTVVTEDVAPYTVVAGNPATTIGHRFDADTVASLLGIRWWDWPHDLILERVQDLCSDDVEGFVRRYAGPA
jgi:acetyltransferase-like isoleucine patch superfamily enzyme